MDIASPNTEEVTTARWFVMRAYKSEKKERRRNSKVKMVWNILFRNVMP